MVRVSIRTGKNTIQGKLLDPGFGPRVSHLLALSFVQSIDVETWTVIGRERRNASPEQRAR